MLNAAVVITILSAPSTGVCWEFNIESASLYFNYVYASQAGPNGFFGPFNTDNSSGGGDYAPLNGWFQTKMVSGTTAESSSTRFAIFPVLKLNNAIAIRGTYRINSDITTATDLASLLNPDLENVISYGRWTRLWLTVETPLGTILYGRRGFRQACGFQFSSAETAEDIFDSGRRSVEMFLLQTHWGPLTIGGGFYPWRVGSSDYWNVEDQNAARKTHVLGYLNYAAGNIETGVGGFYFASHEGPESQKSSSSRRSYPPRETTTTEGWLYLKYNDGRFFINTEADWFYRTIGYLPAMNGFLPTPDSYNMNPVADSGDDYLPPYTESWRYMAELGVYSGPAKISALLAHMPGPDRRHGVLINTQPYVQEAERSAFAIFYQYGILMGKLYRAGVNSFLDMSASDVLAARFDYMPATNMNILVTVMKANRSSYGYGWGYVRPEKINELATNFGNLNFRNRGSYNSPVPTIPDNDLGWEVNVGIMWKLLENWRIYARGAYWRPGKWFNYACIDKSVPNWDNPSQSNNYGINPDRNIAPVFGFELYLDTRL